MKGRTGRNRRMGIKRMVTTRPDTVRWGEITQEQDDMCQIDRYGEYQY